MLSQILQMCDNYQVWSKWSQLSRMPEMATNQIWSNLAMVNMHYHKRCQKDQKLRIDAISVFPNIAR